MGVGHFTNTGAQKHNVKLHLPCSKEAAKSDCCTLSVDYGNTNLFRAMIASVFQEEL